MWVKTVRHNKGLIIIKKKRSWKKARNKRKGKSILKVKNRQKNEWLFHFLISYRTVSLH